MTRNQKIVAVGAASGVFTSIMGTLIIYSLWPKIAGMESTARRLSYAIQCCVFVVLPLFLFISMVANNRFHTKAIDPMLGKEDESTIINGHVADNTLQQYTLFVTALLGFSVNAHPDQMKVIPAATITFICMRMAFWTGYRIQPLYRAFGMAGTSYLNLILLIWAVSKVLVA